MDPSDAEVFKRAFELYRHVAADVLPGPKRALPLDVEEFIQEPIEALLDLKQADIARILDVTPGFVSLVKSRERALTLDHLERIAQALSVPLGAFLLAIDPPLRLTLDPLDQAPVRS